MPIFTSTSDYSRFVKTFIYYSFDAKKPKFSAFNPKKHILEKNKKTVSILSYCLMPNHFHFLLKEVKQRGITEFISKISNSYTKYFNIKRDRVGHLFQGEFRSVPIESDEQLIHVSRYIHLNPFVSKIVNSAEKYKWSSYYDYINNNSGNNFIDKDSILYHFTSRTSIRILWKINKNMLKHFSKLNTIFLITSFPSQGWKARGGRL